MSDLSNSFTDDDDDFKPVRKSKAKAILSDDESDIISSDNEEENDKSLNITSNNSHDIINETNPHHSSLEGSQHISDSSNTEDIIPDSFHSRDSISNSVPSANNSVEIVTEPRETIEIVSSDSETEPTPILPAANLTQPRLQSFFKPKVEPQTVRAPSPPKNGRLVSPEEYQAQFKRVRDIEQQLVQTRNAMRTIRLDTLPDKGEMLRKKEQGLETMVRTARNVLEGMTIKEKPISVYDRVQIAWEDLEAGVGTVVPKTFGKKGIERFNAEKHMTMETLGELHKSLENCPKEGEESDPPEGLKVTLMPHQKRALAWLLWRERQKPSGGILADDMGLGKTLTMISLVIKSIQMNEQPREDIEEEKENTRKGKYEGGTLVVCPASLLNQWSGEVTARCKRGLISVEQYHGPKRETNARALSEHDLVITTYSIIMNEANSKGAVFRVKWRRIILDEAHQIRNFKSQTSVAVCDLSAKSRWALTGTPIHNKELDMFALLKFLRCTPFDNLAVWKHWMHDKSSGGQERLNTVISSIMLRRTKAELMAKGSLQNLPGRNWELIALKLDKDEQEVYQRVLIFSRTLFAQFLHQRAEKNQDNVDLRGVPAEANSEYFKVRNKLLKMNKVKEVSQHEILVLLLRLRQICCHPSLITQMLEGNEDLGNAENEEERDEINLIEQLNKMNLNESTDFAGIAQEEEEKTNIKEASKGFLNPSHPVFNKDRRSSKIAMLIKLLKEKLPEGDKAIVISQWTSYLELISKHFVAEGIKFSELNGKIPVHKRMVLVDEFNNPKHPTRVLLLSLTAGGVGLNLVGANHLFLMDLHWNPQLENQAQDRIYRMGQTKPIFVYKFMAEDTIEERIKALQDNKLQIADAMLTGTKQIVQNKLSLQDLKMLFDFK